MTHGQALANGRSGSLTNARIMCLGKLQPKGTGQYAVGKPAASWYQCEGCGLYLGLSAGVVVYQDSQIPPTLWDGG